MAKQACDGGRISLLGRNARAGIEVHEGDEIILNLRDRFLRVRILEVPKGNVSKAYNVRSHPVKYLINRQGEIVSVSLGYQDWASDKVKARMDILMADPS